MNRGYRFEAEVVDLLREAFPGCKAHRIVGSGRHKHATKTGAQDERAGDVSFAHDAYPGLLIECKHRKGRAVGAKSTTIEKAWLDEIRAQATKVDKVPVYMFRFKGARRDENAIHVVLPFDVFVHLMARTVPARETDAGVAATLVADLKTVLSRHGFSDK